MFNFLTQIIKKNYFIYLFFRFLYEKIFMFCYRRIKNSIIFLINYKKNNFFKLHQKEEAKTIFCNKEFYYHKYSFYYDDNYKIKNQKTQSKYDIDRTFEKENNLIIKEFFEKEIECILDVGANIGYTSSFYNAFFGNKVKIHCFEPHPVSYYFLKKNLSPFDNIKLYNFALGNENKEDYISIPNNQKFRMSNLGLMSIGQNSNILKTKILVKKFDLLPVLFQQFKEIYIKIDVEGYEENVLKGMYNFLNRNLQIYLKIEINRNYLNIKKINSLINFLETLNYKFFAISNEKFINLNKSELIKYLIYRNTNLFCKKLAP
jgi:FkbM family methyltransferase